MSEIRDRAILQLVNILVNYEADRDHSLSQSVDKILAIPELAIVDRDAELPPNPLPNPPDDEGEIISWLGYNEAQRDMLKAGYVKEIIDDTIRGE